MKKGILVITLLTGFFITSCDKIDAPYIKTDNTVNTDVEFPDIDPSQVVRHILVEEFTGQQCPNCPSQGHIPLKELLESDPTVVPVAIHAGSFAIPTGNYPNDFRTDIGNKLYSQFVTGGIPCAMINRVKYNGSYAITSQNWNAAIAEIDRNDIVGAIQIINKTDGDALTVHTKTTILKDYENKLILSVFLTEDSIVGPQLDGSERIEEYVHNHLLRAAVNGTDGAYLSQSGLVEKDSSYTKSYGLSFADKNWRKEHCKIVAFIFDSETQEVLQAETAAVEK